MCGIVGYIGTKNKATGFVLEGLQTLEYRGYDSAGVATITPAGPLVIKQTGQVEALKHTVQTTLKKDTLAAIGHTRWATHGAPTTNNAHPHSNTAGTIFVVHNGIIENYAPIKAELISKGYHFKRDTDTEVLVNCIEDVKRNNNGTHAEARRSG